MTKIVKEQIGFHYFAIYFDSFEVEINQIGIKIGNKSITHNIFRIQDNECLFSECVFSE